MYVSKRKLFLFKNIEQNRKWGKIRKSIGIFYICFCVLQQSWILDILCYTASTIYLFLLFDSSSWGILLWMIWFWIVKSSVLTGVLKINYKSTEMAVNTSACSDLFQMESNPFSFIQIYFLWKVSFDIVILFLIHSTYKLNTINMQHVIWYWVKD